MGLSLFCVVCVCVCVCVGGGGGGGGAEYVRKIGRQMSERQLYYRPLTPHNANKCIV